MRTKIKISKKLLTTTLAIGLATGLGACSNSGLKEVGGSGASTEAGDHKCGEGKCGEGKCGEGKCGEGKCGEGKCGGGH